MIKTQTKGFLSMCGDLLRQNAHDVKCYIQRAAYTIYLFNQFYIHQDGYILYIYTFILLCKSPGMPDVCI